MSYGKPYKPVGGVVAAEVFPVRGLASPQDMTEGRGVAVPLAGDGSRYGETFSVDTGRVSVEHLLVLRSDRNLSAAWFDGEFLRACAAEGAAARIRLATGETLTVGWSERFGFEQALRLRSLSFASGGRAADAPCTELVLASHDTSTALDGGNGDETGAERVIEGDAAARESGFVPDAGPAAACGGAAAVTSAVSADAPPAASSEEDGYETRNTAMAGKGIYYGK